VKTVIRTALAVGGVSLMAVAVAVLASEVVAPQSPVEPGSAPSNAADSTAVSFYDLKTTTLGGASADLGEYRGSVSLVVNVASKCAYTPQYEGLEQLHREMEGRDFNVLGFPSNDFGGQEPGSAQEIADFCRLTYDVTFPMFEKVATRSGAGQSPIYRWLGSSGNLPAWNFSKYVIDKQGRVVAFFSSVVTPEDHRLRAAIAQAMAAK
jgi:glutathione peroxidase